MEGKLSNEVRFRAKVNYHVPPNELLAWADKIQSLEAQTIKSIKLFIWREIRCDYTCGIGFAMASDKMAAIDAIKEASEDWEWDSYAGELLSNEPEIHDEPFGDWISGGG